MKKNENAKKDRKPQGRVPKQPKDVTVLTDQDLEQVPGGEDITVNCGTGMSKMRWTPP